MVENKDWSAGGEPRITRPRPGHADLVGILKYAREDIRDVLERASARETVTRVAVGAVCKRLLKEFEIRIISYTKKIGGVSTSGHGKISVPFLHLSVEKIFSLAESSPVRTLDKKVEKLMINKIKEAEKKGDTLGGVFTVIVHKVPVGLGSYTQWDLRLDGRLAQTLMSIPGVKGVEIGTGFNFAQYFGSKAHDEIFYSKTRGFYRKTNNAGGLEGGVSNGEDIILNAAIKPISSLRKPLRTVDIVTKEKVRAEIIRGDICVVPVAGIIGEAVVAIEIARAMCEKFGGDSLKEMKTNFLNYQKYLSQR